MIRLRVFALLLCLTVPVGLTSSCATGGGLVTTTPTPVQIEAIRLAAARIADGVTTSLSITQAVGRFIDTLPMSVEQKNEFDRAIIAVTGTTAAPGPLVAGLKALETVSAEPELRATVTVILTVLDPLINKLIASDNAGVSGFGLALQTAMVFSRAYMIGGGA